MDPAIKGPSSAIPPKVSESGFKENQKSQTKEPQEKRTFQLSGGEIHYLYWVIQVSIMVPDIRHQLRRA